MAETEVDVFICGAGPVGLLLAYQLRRFGHSVYIIDRDDKAAHDYPMYGRACTLYAGTLEILDRLDLLDDFAQEGFASSQARQWLDGKLINSDAGIFADPEINGMSTTFMPAMLNLRLKYAEDILRRRLREFGTNVIAPVELSTYYVDDTAGNDHKVKITCRHRRDNATLDVAARYIVGADGGGSMVRKLAEIPFEGSRDEQVAHIVRMDGIFETSMPYARCGFAAIETKTHGHILWVPLDHGASRMGYTLSRELLQKYGYKLTAEQAIAEAKKAMASHYTLECKELHWHTVYGVQQYVAARFQDQDRILLAGDAGHTHSSALAQGMNTGVHDATNMAWKLSGILKGMYQPDVLATYEVERRPVAQRLIENDKILARLISDKTPGSLKKWIETTRDNASWAVGLAIVYDSSVLNQHTTSPVCKIKPGRRVYDAQLQKPSMLGSPTRLNELQKNNGRFIIMVLAGDPALPGIAQRLKCLRKQVDEAGFSKDLAEFMTIAMGHGNAFDEYLSVPRFGRGYFDPDGSTHMKYGVDPEQGAVLVVRPDGVLGMAAALDDFVAVGVYFDAFVLKRALSRVAHANENNQVAPKSGAEYVIEGNFVGNDGSS